MSKSDYHDNVFEMHLVRSYMPLFLLALRAVLLVLGMQVVSMLLEDTPVFICLCVLVYFDAYAFRHDPLNQAVGFLVPTACAVYVNVRGAVAWPEVDDDCTQVYKLAPYWAADILWAATSSMLVVAVCFRVAVQFRVHGVALVWAGMALAHVMLGCMRAFAWWELLLRVAWYHASAAVFFLSSIVLAGVDRNTHSFTVMHVNMHVLFVEGYVLMASVAVSLGVYAYLYWQHAPRLLPVPPPAQCPPAPEARRPAREAAPPNSPDDLLAQLRAAKAGAV